MVSKSAIAFTFGFAGLFFCAVLFSDFLPSVFGAYADQRLLLSLSLIALITFSLLKFSYYGLFPQALKELWPFVLLISSFAFAAQRHSGDFIIVEPVFYILFFLAFGLGGGLLRYEHQVEAAVRAIVIVIALACFFYAAMTLTVYLFAIIDGFSRLDQVIPWGFVNIRYWSHIATWLVPILPLCLLGAPSSCKSNKLWQLGVAFAAAMWWWVLIMSASRGSMIGLLLGFSFTWIVFGRAALPWVKLTARFAFYGVCTWLILSLLIPSLVFDELQVRGIKGGGSGRFPLWLEAWAMSLQHFPFGMGPQAWLTHEVLTEAYHQSKKFGHPHNMYLLWAAEYGWVSIAGLIVLCGSVLVRLFRRALVIKETVLPEGMYLMAFTASVVAALVHAGVSAVFIAPGSMLIGLLVLTLFWALVQPELCTKPLPRKHKNLAQLIGYATALLILMISALWFREVIRYQQAMSEDLIYYQEEISLGQLPRFWFHGYFPRQQGLMPNARPSDTEK